MIDTPKDPYDIDFGDEEPAKKKAEPLDLSVKPKKPDQESVLLVIRHGNTFEAGEAPRRIGARTDLPLTAEGRAQMVRLRDHLEAAGRQPYRVYAGPLQRTMQSAGLVAPSYEIVEFLREIYHGLDENKTEDIVLRNVGRAALEAWDKEGKLPAGWTADVLGIRQGWQGLKKLCRDHGGLWAAVTSNGIARFVFDEVENIPENRKLSTGAYGMLAYDRERHKWVCRGWNIRP